VDIQANHLLCHQNKVIDKAFLAWQATTKEISRSLIFIHSMEQAAQTPSST
jgi:hypothetical protein